MRSTCRCAMARQVDHQGGSTACTSTTRSARLRDSQLGDPVREICKLHPARARCGRPSNQTHRPVVLIDEIDKADIEFPNDLLRELDRMEFYVLRDARLDRACEASAAGDHYHETTRRSCRTHSCAAASSTTSAFPTARRCRRSSRSHYPGIRKAAAAEALEAVLRAARNARPEEEALDVGAARLAQAAAGRGHPAGSLRSEDKKKALPPLYGALLKNEQDVHLFERLIFMARRAADRSMLIMFFLI
jgi:MoxR-like ATPase